jgi:hypothetical protein
MTSRAGSGDAHPIRASAAWMLRAMRGCASLIAAAMLAAAAPASAQTGPPPIAEVLDSVRVPAAGPDGSEISELSGLAWDEDEQLLYAVSDAGYLIQFRIAIENDKLAKIEPAAVFPLEEFEASLLKLTWTLSDAESVLVRNADNGKNDDTELVVALEDGPALARFTPEGKFIEELRLPPPLDSSAAYSSSNKRLESVSEIPGLGVITAPEAPLYDEPEDIHTMYALDGAKWQFSAVQPKLSSIKDMAILPDGRQMVLERTRDDNGGGTNAHLRILDLATCAPDSECPVTEVAPDSPEPLKLDFEGLARISNDLYLLVTDEPAGKTGGGQMLLFRLR